METGVIEITFSDGRKYNVFFENRTQKDKVLNWIRNDKHHGIASHKFIVRGIHKANYFLSEI